MKRFLPPLVLFALITTLFYAARLFIPDSIRLYVGLAIPWLYLANIIISSYIAVDYGAERGIRQYRSSRLADDLRNQSRGLGGLDQREVGQ
jgi:hypothetical protein